MTKKPARTNAQTPVIITGYSGAGISTSLKLFEDLGYEVFDNFPLGLIPALLKDTKKSQAIAIGIDTRARGFKPETVLQIADKAGAALVFMTCDESVLQKRFITTRRRHPLAQGTSVKQGIATERKMLKTLQNAAHIVIDTTDMNVHDLRHVIHGHFEQTRKTGLVISLMSFGFRNGVPREADIVMDIRFLKNPNWVPGLKEKTGLDKKVADYIRKDPAWKNFMKNFRAMLKPLIPLYEKEGKHYLTVAIGCTGGRHRSVFTVKELSAWLKAAGYTATTEHRDLKK